MMPDRNCNEDENRIIARIARLENEVEEIERIVREILRLVRELAVEEENCSI